MSEEKSDNTDQDVFKGQPEQSPGIKPSQSSQPSNIESTKPEQMETSESTSSNAPYAGLEPTPGKSNETAYTAPDSSPYIEPIVNFIGPKNDAIVFSSALESPEFRDLDDDFFNLKITDVNVLHRDIKTADKHTDEGGPLMTSATREAEEEGAKLALLGRYRHAVLRIQFSTGLVVQGVFSPGTTMQEVLDWLGPLLTHPAGGELYTAPPRTTLPPSSTLLDLGLLPAALVHFSHPSAHLTEVATENMSNAAGANVEAAKYRKGKDKPEKGLNDELPERTSVVPSVMESRNVEDLQMSSFSVLITGCNRGIGLELVKQFLRQDHPPDHLFATARSTTDAGELSQLAAANENLQLIQLDVTNYDDYPEVVNEVSQIVGDKGLNLLINNAGVMPQNGDLESVTPEDMRSTFEVNCVAPLFLTKAMLPLIKQAAQTNAEKSIGIRKAAIIQMSSSRASFMKNSGGQYAYRCSKVGLNMAMKSLSVDLAGTNILELSMHPDWVQTDMGGPNARISTEECCNTMINTLEGLTEKDHGTFLRHNNIPIPLSPSAQLTELVTENLSNATGANVEAAQYRLTSVMNSGNVENLQRSNFSVLITGCNRGIGLELVKQFLRQDHPPDHLFATARSTTDAGELSQLAASNENLHLLQLDVTNYEDYPLVVNEVGQIVGDEGLNLLINNAGVMPQNGDLESVTPEDMRNTFEVNCVAPLFLTRAMLPLIKQAAQTNAQKPIGIRKAAVIQMSSSGGSFMKNSGGMYAYRCSKVALNMAMKTLSMDLAGTNILELSMHPDWVQTDMGGPKARISTEECCNTMINTLQGLTEKDHGTFLRYNNSPMPW